MYWGPYTDSRGVATIEPLVWAWQKRVQRNGRSLQRMRRTLRVELINSSPNSVGSCGQLLKIFITIKIVIKNLSPPRAISHYMQRRFCIITINCVSISLSNCMLYTLHCRSSFLQHLVNFISIQLLLHYYYCLRERSALFNLIEGFTSPW